jgi:hypothetical protein
MSGLYNLNLIHFFDFYLILMFILNTCQRFRHYWDSAGLVLTGPHRWPNLFKLVKQHRTVFMTWATILPGILALVLSLFQLLASWLVWPHATMKLDEMLDYWPVLFIFGPVTLAMLVVDVYFVIFPGTIDRAMLEKHFDQAEFWLRSGAAHVLRVVTLGFINPRQMVDEEVRKSLIITSNDLNVTLWWVTLQLGLRVAFGVTIWLTWAFTQA